MRMGLPTACSLKVAQAVSSAGEFEQSGLSLCCVSSSESMKEQSTAGNSSSNEVVNESSICVQSDLTLLDVSVSCSYHKVGDELGNSSSDQPSISLKCYQPCNAYPMQLKNNLDVSTKAPQLSLIDPTPPDFSGTPLEFFFQEQSYSSHHS